MEYAAEWTAFVAQLETAEEEFVQGRPAVFQALWSRADEVTLCGGFGGVEHGWKNVTDRLSWVSKKYSAGTRTREETIRVVAGDFAYLVQKEVIHSRLGFQVERSTLDDGISPRGGWLAHCASPCRFADGY